MNLYENLARALALLNGLHKRTTAPNLDALEEAIGRLGAAVRTLEAESDHVRGTALAVGPCHLHRAECAAEVTIHLPGGKHATACLSRGNLSALVELLQDHAVPLDVTAGPIMRALFTKKGPTP